MRRWAAAMVAGSALVLAVPGSAAAHPGATDANGGHTCSTNCPAYGLDYGEYHTHGGGGTAGSGSRSGGGTSVISQADCDARRITRRGRRLSREECERLIGQRVSLADTGFEAWMVGAAGLVCLLGAVALRRGRPSTSRAG
jgi:hypothetical protein